MLIELLLKQKYRNVRRDRLPDRDKQPAPFSMHGCQDPSPLTE